MKPRLRTIPFSLAGVVVGVAAVFGCLLLLTSQDFAAQSAAPPLSIIVKTQQKRLHLNQPINLLVQVVNTSKTVQSFQVMGCSWQEEWQASDPRIILPGVNCAANPIITIILAPGESYKKALEMQQMQQWLGAGKPLGPGRLYFRLGFTPEGQGKTVMGRFADAPYKSAPIMLDIIK